MVTMSQRIENVEKSQVEIQSDIRNINTKANARDETLNDIRKTIKEIQENLTNKVVYRREYDVHMKIIGTVALLLLSAMIMIVVQAFGG